MAPHEHPEALLAPGVGREGGAEVKIPAAGSIKHTEHVEL